MDRAWVRIPRSLLSGLFFLLFGVFAVLISLAVLPFAWSERIVRGVVRLAFRAFVLFARITGLFRVRVVRGEGAPDPGAIRSRVVVMNHPTLIDVIVLMSAIPDSTCVTKGGLRRNFFMRFIVQRMFLVNDDDPERTIARGGKLLADGVNVIVFPQGTRNGERLRRGAARLALAAGADVVPVHLAVSHRILAKGQPWWDVADGVIEFRLEFKEEIKVSGESNHRNAVALTERIGALILPAGK